MDKAVDFRNRERSATSEHRSRDKAPRDGIGQYLHEISHFAFLTKPQEQEVAAARDNLRNAERRCFLSNAVALNYICDKVIPILINAKDIESLFEDVSKKNLKQLREPVTKHALANLATVRGILERNHEDIRALPEASRRKKEHIYERVQVRLEHAFSLVQELRLRNKFLAEIRAHVKESFALLSATSGAAKLPTRESQQDILTLFQVKFTEMKRFQQDAIDYCKAYKEKEGQLAKSNLRLVVSIAKEYVGRGMPLEDLIEEGNDGLLYAITKFDRTRGFRLTTYATPWIRNYMERAIEEKKDVIAVSSHVHGVRSSLAAATEEFCQANHKMPTPEDLAEFTGNKFGRDRRKAIRKINECTPFNIASLDEGTGFYDLRDESLAADPGAVVESVDDPIFSGKLSLRDLLSSLEQREREVIILRFKLKPEDALTSDELNNGVGERIRDFLSTINGSQPTLKVVGGFYGLTRERIRQIESDAIRKMSRLASA